MRGLMMDRPLLITSLIQYAAAYHGATEIVTKTVEGPIHRYTYCDAYIRIQRLAHALQELGVKPGDRVAVGGDDWLRFSRDNSCGNGHGRNAGRWRWPGQMRSRAPPSNSGCTSSAIQSSRI